MAFEYNHRIELTNGPGIFKVMADAEAPKTGLYWEKYKGEWKFELKFPYDYVVLLMAGPEYQYPIIGKDKSVIAFGIYKYQIQRIFTV